MQGMDKIKIKILEIKITIKILEEIKDQSNAKIAIWRRM